MTVPAQVFSLALLHFLWQGVAVAFVLWLTLTVLRGRSANARYAACCAAMALMVALPVATALLVGSAPPAQQGIASSQVWVATAPPTSAAPGRPGFQWIAALQSWALPVWSIGVFLFSIRLAWGCHQVSLLRRRGTPADGPVLAMVATLSERLGLTRAVRVLVAGGAESPSVVGWLRPVILAPAAALAGLSAEQLEAVLAHELAHIRRHDYLVNLLQMFAETLLFYHPAVWWVSGRMRHERELCCDDLAVRCCGSAVRYARALATLERMRVTAPAMAVGANGGSMLFRVQRLLGRAPEQAPSKFPGILALTVGVVCCALNVHWAQGQEPKPTRVYVMTGGARDGAGVSVDLGGAALLHRTGVEYPGPARERHIEGTVVAEVTLDATGAVSDALILSGPQEMRRSLLRTLLEWHFAPGAAGAVKQVRVLYQNSGLSEAPQAEERREPEPAWASAKQEEQASLQEDAAKMEKEQQRNPAGKLVELQRKPEQIREARNGAQEPEQASAAGEQELRNQLRESEMQYEALERERSRQAAQTEVAGHRLKSINISGVEEADKVELMSRLAIHLGDTLTADSIKTAVAAAKQFDGRLEVVYNLTSDGMVEFRVAMPGAKLRAEQRSLTGRTIKSINVFGLEDGPKSDLIARLPVHVGDTLGAEPKQTITSAVRQFDEHLEVGFSVTSDGEVEVRITAPGARERQYLFVKE